MSKFTNKRVHGPGSKGDTAADSMEAASHRDIEQEMELEHEERYANDPVYRAEADAPEGKELEAGEAAAKLVPGARVEGRPDNDSFERTLGQILHGEVIGWNAEMGGYAVKWDEGQGGIGFWELGYLRPEQIDTRVEPCQSEQDIRKYARQELEMRLVEYAVMGGNLESGPFTYDGLTVAVRFRFGCAVDRVFVLVYDVDGDISVSEVR